MLALTYYLGYLAAMEEMESNRSGLGGVGVGVAVAVVVAYVISKLG